MKWLNNLGGEGKGKGRYVVIKSTFSYEQIISEIFLYASNIRGFGEGAKILFLRPVVAAICGVLLSLPRHSAEWRVKCFDDEIESSRTAPFKVQRSKNTKKIKKMHFYIFYTFKLFIKML